jgi:hypothetical protein
MTSRKMFSARPSLSPVLPLLSTTTDCPIAEAPEGGEPSALGGGSTAASAGAVLGDFCRAPEEVTKEGRGSETGRHPKEDESSATWMRWEGFLCLSFFEAGSCVVLSYLEECPDLERVVVADGRPRVAQHNASTITSTHKKHIHDQYKTPHP